MILCQFTKIRDTWLKSVNPKLKSREVFRQQFKATVPQNHTTDVFLSSPKKTKKKAYGAIIFCSARRVYILTAKILFIFY